LIHNLERYLSQVAHLAWRDCCLLERSIIGEDCTSVCEEVAPQDTDLGCQLVCLVEKSVNIGRSLCRDYWIVSLLLAEDGRFMVSLRFSKSVVMAAAGPGERSSKINHREIGPMR
jgi:hypothetical protein